jgi:hypothetical protein
MKTLVMPGSCQSDNITSSLIPTFLNSAGYIQRHLQRCVTIRKPSGGSARFKPETAPEIAACGTLSRGGQATARPFVGYSLHARDRRCCLERQNPANKCALEHVSILPIKWRKRDGCYPAPIQRAGTKSPFDAFCSPSALPMSKKMKSISLGRFSSATCNGKHGVLSFEVPC